MEYIRLDEKLLGLYIIGSPDYLIPSLEKAEGCILPDTPSILINSV